MTAITVARHTPSELGAWCANARNIYAVESAPIHSGDARHELLSAEAKAIYSDNPATLGEALWNARARSLLTVPPIATPEWATSSEIVAEMHDDGRVMVFHSRGISVGDVRVYIEEIDEVDIFKETVLKTPGSALVQIDGEIDGIWVRLNQLPQLVSSLRTAADVLTAVAA